MEKSLAERAYEATKDEGDPHYLSLPATLRGELDARVDGVVRTGLTVNNFEEKVKELHDADKSKVTSLLGTKNTLDEAQTEANDEKPLDDERPLTSLTRAELDELATKEFGFNPSDYSNKAEIIAAIEKARG